MLNWYVGGPRQNVASTLQESKGYLPTEAFIVCKNGGAIVARVWKFTGSSVGDIVESAPCGFLVMIKEREKSMTQDLEGRRKDQKLSRAKLSELCGLSQATIARIEKGGSRTTEDEIKTITDALDANEAANPATDAEPEGEADPS